MQEKPLVRIRHPYNIMQAALSSTFLIYDDLKVRFELDAYSNLSFQIPLKG